jgi:hypothetical protein
MPALPPAIAWIIGAIGAVALAKLIAKEWRRVNEDLDRARTVPLDESERAGMPELRRDPETDVYRPQRR